MSESRLKRASDILERLELKVQRGRYAESDWRDSYNAGLDALFQALEDAGMFAGEVEYGNRIQLSEEAHGPGVFVVEKFDEETARTYARGSKNHTLVCRTVGPWEVVDD